MATQQTEPVSDPRRRAGDESGVHLYSALLVLIVDNIFWGANTLTLGLGTFAASFLSFALTTIGVFLVQRNLVGESTGKAGARAFFLGVLAGIPTAVAGTVAGGLLLGWAGIRRLRD